MSWLSSKMMKQQSPEQLQQLLMGGGVSGMLDQQQGLFGGMMQGQIPDAVRQQMMGAGADAATSAGNQMKSVTEYFTVPITEQSLRTNGSNDSRNDGTRCGRYAECSWC